MSLAQHIARQREHLEAFITVLEAERESLSAGQVDGQRLSEQARQKQAQVTQLERLETQRLSAQRRLGYGEGRQGAETAARDAGCLDAWLEFRQRALHARQLNQLNGLLIGSRLAQNQKILDFLRNAAGQALYGPDGQSRLGSLGGVSSCA
ncbi:flagella synthesis protein FlgN [Modicisalibacter ilicicola DSM 19980]|uniref:Flagella synthesis protein FlgN n=1 Tax=Modicisalibacter ilicicola DSM 19980 TaxID=1121942 RepID=A0A1M4Z179_9GAMM|nr:flagellar protein FlgN [Halomonas ilicicola]SHF11725.1 flagella synthesis protein FlgN [Halomonas ilicicola DSM 19980]